MIDVDYYLSLRQLGQLAALQRPIIMYTILPESVGGMMDESEFYFDNDYFVQKTRSGRVYRHKLWNWDLDIVSIRAYGKIFPKNYYVTFQVERKQLESGKGLVLLTPIAKLSTWRAKKFIPCTNSLLYGLGLPSLGGVETTPLRRLSVKSKAKNYNVLRVLWRNRITYSLGLNGQPHSYTYSSAVWQAAWSNLQSKVWNLSALDDTEKDVNYYAFLKVYVSLQQADMTTLSGFRNEAPRVTAPRDADDRGSDEPCLRPIAGAMSEAAGNPIRSESNLTSALQVRMLEPSDVGDVDKAFVAKWQTDFINHFPTDLKPITLEQIEEEGRANQAKNARTAQDDVEEARRKIQQIFLKAEPVNLNKEIPKPPHLIVNVDGLNSVMMARYAYRVESWLYSTVPAYAFGKTPSKIAERVAEVCKSATSSVLLSDIISMDGSIKEGIRAFEHLLLKHMFGDTSEVTELHKNLLKVRLAAFHKVLAHTLAQRLSGERLTAVFNTIIKMFMAYCALRESGYDDTQAWLALGQYGGDDGITKDVTKKIFERAARALGFRVKIEVVARGDWGVNFLNRYYTKDVWTGDPSSSRDVLRCIRGLHLTASRNAGLSDLELVTLKAQDILIHDPCTVLISSWAQAVLRWAVHCGINPDSDQLDAVSYNSRKEVRQYDDFAYPNGPDDHVVQKLIDDHVDVYTASLWLWLNEKPSGAQSGFTDWLDRTPMLHRCETKPSIDLEIDGVRAEKGKSDILSPVAVPQTALANPADVHPRPPVDSGPNGEPEILGQGTGLPSAGPIDPTPGVGVRPKAELPANPEHPTGSSRPSLEHGPTGPNATRNAKRRARRRAAKLAAGNAGNAASGPGDTNGPPARQADPGRQAQGGKGDKPKPQKARSRSKRAQRDGKSVSPESELQAQIDDLFPKGGPRHGKSKTRGGQGNGPSESTRSSDEVRGNTRTQKPQNQNKNQKPRKTQTNGAEQI
jgi:hypothetical protein